MKIIVFSDSHGDVDSMVTVVQKTQPDIIIHLGDNTKDAIQLSKIYKNKEILIVRGNTDYGTAISVEKTIEVKGRKIFFTHGHRYGVSSGMHTIYYRGREEDADIVLFGHTHIPYLENKQGITLMNPGKAGINARGLNEASFGLIKIGKEIYYEVLPISNLE